MTTTIPAIAETPAAFSGIFRWGPVMTRILLGSENDLVKRFGKPTNLNGETWFSVSSFLAYGGFLYVVRTGDTAGQTQLTYGNCANGNNVVLCNTTGLGTGMKMFFSNNAAVFDVSQAAPILITSVNSTSVHLSDSPNSTSANVEIVFRTNIFYNAVALEIPNVDITDEWADSNIYSPQDYLIKDGSFDPEILYIAKWPGAVGNSLRVAVCDNPIQFNSNVDLSPQSMVISNVVTNTSGYFDNTQCFVTANVQSNVLSVVVAPLTTSNAAMVVAANIVAGAAWASLTLGDLILTGNSSIGFQTMKVTGYDQQITKTNNVFSFSIDTQDNFRLHANCQTETLNRYWEFYNYAGDAPGQSDYVFTFGNTDAQDELHVVVVDDGGAFTGDPGTILEIYKHVSRATDAKNLNNTGNYYKTVINQGSQYIWWASDRSTAMSQTAEFVTSSTATDPLNVTLTFGEDGLDEATIDLGALINGYSQFISAEDVDISLIITGKGRGIPINSNTGLATWLIENIAQTRKDCIVLCSPDINLVVNNVGFEADDIATARDAMPSTSYGVMDSGYKYMYDRYNDLYRWIPLNGDIAGLCAQTDMTNAPWWSPAGFNRGNIKNVVVLAWNPKETDRDTLYSNDVNPVVHFRDMGVVLYGDKTLFHKPSAFNRINVRRLFIVLEKAIATASKFYLFEFNDEFTRSQFKSMVNPFLKQIQSQRGITGFFVRCDATNNTPWIIQNNEFVADIFIRPNYSINWILLNFINVPPTLSFAEAETLTF